MSQGRVIYSDDEVVVRLEVKDDEHHVMTHRKRREDGMEYEILPRAYMLGHNILIFNRKEHT